MLCTTGTITDMRTSNITSSPGMHKFDVTPEEVLLLPEADAAVT
jgi:hypothetical protein